MKRFIVLGKDFDFLLDAFDVFSPNCPLRYICNVSELITGWRLKIWMFLEKHRRLWRITKIWKKFFIYPNLSIDRENEIYLLVSTSWISFMHEGYAEYFKKHFPKSHIIVFFTDNATKYTWIDIDHMWWSDWTITFNPRDVLERKWGFFMDVNSKIHKDITSCGNKESDIFYCGAARNRLDKLHQCYTYFSEMGLKCDFYITDVPPEQQLKGSNIIYNTPLSYKEVQKKSALTRCILEITDKNADGFTYRIEEAIMYNTKIITDVPFIKHTTWYNPDGMFCFDEITDVDKEWILAPVMLDYHYDEEWSPNELVKLLENHFSPHPVYPCTKWQYKSDEYIRELCVQQ